MKNSIKFCLLLTLSSVLFFACGSSRSLTKKHYNNRYYIGMSKSENAKAEEKSTNNSASTEVIKTETTITAVETKTETVPTTQTNSAIEPPDMSANSTTVNTDDEKKSIDQSTDKQPSQTVKNKDAKFKITEFPYAITKKIVDTKEKLSVQSAEGDALSLLWIVIIVLLILWALGWLAGGLGMGGLIHVLLIIALILLILWLLRVI